MQPLSKLEKETIIRYNNSEDNAVIETYDIRQKKILKKLAISDPEVVYIDSNGFGAANYELPKQYIRIRGKNKLKDKEARSERCLKNMHH